MPNVLVAVRIWMGDHFTDVSKIVSAGRRRNNITKYSLMQGEMKRG